MEINRACINGTHVSFSVLLNPQDQILEQCRGIVPAIVKRNGLVRRGGVRVSELSAYVGHGHGLRPEWARNPEEVVEQAARLS